MDIYFLGTVSFIAILFLSGVVCIGAKKIRFPYTIALVASGLLLGILVKLFPSLGFLITFELTKETLLYIFFPVLLFESAYNIKFREITQHARAISLLAALGLIISALISATLLFFALGLTGIHIPFLVLFTFGALISATDPVAVLALFKEMGAPKRLTLIFEGESLFNDATALALLGVILSVLLHDASHHSVFAHMIEPLIHSMGQFGIIFSGLLSFFLMILFGAIIGGLIGYGASRSIPYIKKIPVLEVALTLIIAHATFLFAEWMNHIIVPTSPFVATILAAIIMGNYGRYKLSSETRYIMGEYWEFFAFIVNSMVFFLVGIMIAGLHIEFSELWLPILLSIIIVAVARAISVYAVLIPLNWTKKEFHIPTSWMHLLSWGSLRGGLSIILALFIPEDFTLAGWPLETSIRDFVLALTVGCIVFTTFIKATTIPVFLKKLKITTPTSVDNMDYAQGKILFLLKLLAKIESTANRGYMTDSQKQALISEYQHKLDIAHREFFSRVKNNEELESILERTLALHALEIEKSLLMHVFSHHEMPEWILRRMLQKIESQIERVEEGKAQIKSYFERNNEAIKPSLLDKIIAFFSKKRDKDEERYYKARTRMIILEKVLERFEIFKSVEEIANSRAFQTITAQYQELLEKAKKSRKELYKKPEIMALEESIVLDVLSIRQHEIIEGLEHSGLISLKTRKKLEEDFHM